MSQRDCASEPDDDETSAAPRWDADDPRRQKDCFAPPARPCECHCLHCGRVFMSHQIWLQKIIGDNHLDGFWMCPTPNCGGAGFTFDIFPTDPDHPANAGWIPFDDDDFEDDELEPDEAPSEPCAYDPSEPKYQALDEVHAGLPDDDIEGEEWKHGLAPGEQLPEPEWSEQAKHEFEEEEKRYNAPDERPRVLDWTNRPQRSDGGQFLEDDIPF